nr:protein FAR1-related sequence 5-like [Tanacetum cinerariifolium]
YDMVFVPFTGIDNHLKCVNFGSGMLLKEDIEAYTWLLTSFMTTHEKQPTIVVTDQDGAMKRAIEAVRTESKHRLCMWHIMQKVPAKKIYEGCWAWQIQEFKKEEGCDIVKVRDIRADAYRTLYKEEGKETVIQEKDKVVDYKVVRNPEDGSVECTCRHFLHKEQLKQFMEKLENIKKEIQVKVLNPPSQKTGDVIEDIYAIKKPKQNLVNNLQKASNKGGRRGERIKSGREIAMKAQAKRAQKSAAEQEMRTATSVTEQEEKNGDSTHIADKEQSNTAS